MGRSSRSQRYSSSFAMPELTGQTFTPRFNFAPSGPTSIGDADPRIAGARESPLITSTRSPCRRAHSYTSVVA